KVSLTFFYRQMPEVIEQGYLYIAQPPLYKVMRGKSERYLKDDDELNAYLIDEGTSGEALILADGTQIAGEDLRERVRATANFKQALWRLSLRAPGDIVEQAAIAGALAPGASDDEAAEAARRLNVIAEEGEDTWAGSFTDGNLTLVREVRGVEEKAVLDRQLLASADAARLNGIAAQIRPIYVEPSLLRHEKSGEITVTGPVSLLTAVLESGRKGLKIQRYKGLGEMNADQLWETTLDANARTLLQVKVDDALEAGDMFSRLMGDVVEPRRQFIQDNALEAEVDV
ncbi:MAG: DNA gyrase subunit B, partial [Pseudomonadota bacterium]